MLGSHTRCPRADSRAAGAQHGGFQEVVILSEQLASGWYKSGWQLWQDTAHSGTVRFMTLIASD